jgi:hypothetical protein
MAPAFLGWSGSRSAPSTPVECGARKPSRADRGSPAPGAATHRGSQRNRRPRVPASSGARESSTRVRGIESSQGVPARRPGCRSRRAASQVQRSAISPATRSVNGDRARSVARLERRQTMSTTRRRGTAARRDKAGAGRSKERCGAKAPDGWKASRIGILRRRSRAGDGSDLRLLSIVARPRERLRTQRESRQRCQRHGSQAPQRADNARGGQTHAARRSEAPFVKEAHSPLTQALTRLTDTGNPRGAGARTHT